MQYSQSQQYWIWLSSVQGMTARRFDALLERYGPPQRIWEEMGEHLRPIVGAQVYRALVNARSAAYLDALLAAMDKGDMTAVTREDETYPAPLKTIADAPPTLYLRGRAALDDLRLVAIVGARNCSAYGTRMARRIARELSEAGVTVVSGLARGIDSAAHRGAIDMRARTVAVLGCGVDTIYPPENRTLFEEILANGGSVLSEQPPGTPPHGYNFPARNRIISGMSQAVLLVEGSARSGAMSTIHHASEQNRRVFALPGQADSPLAAAPLALIRDGTSMATCAADILSDMGWDDMSVAEEAAFGASLPMTATEQRLFSALSGGSESVDALVETLGTTPSELNSLLTSMEIRGIIRQLPGRRVERTV